MASPQPGSKPLALSTGATAGALKKPIRALRRGAARLGGGAIAAVELHLRRQRPGQLAPSAACGRPR
jgi:hypothetical protein